MEPHQRNDNLSQSESVQHKDIQVPGGPDDYLGLLPKAGPGSGDVGLEHTRQAQDEPISRTTSPTMSTPTLPRPKARIGPFPATSSRDIPRAATCAWCGKTFSRPGGLPRYQSSSCPKRPVNAGVATFVCLECGETRLRKDKIQMHCLKKHGQLMGKERFVERDNEQLRDKGMATFSTEGDAVQAYQDEPKSHAQMRSSQRVESASSCNKGSQTPDSTGVQLKWDNVLGLLPNSLYPSRASEVEPYLPQDSLKGQGHVDLSRLSIDEPVFPNSRPLDLENVVSSDDGAQIAGADGDYFATAETCSRLVDSESHISFHNNSTFRIPLRTTDEQPKPTTTQDAFKPGLTKPEQVSTIDMSWADSDSDMSAQRSSIFSGRPESAHEQSTLPTTHNYEPDPQKFEQPATTDMSYADSIQSDGCILGLDATAKVKLSSELASMIFAELGVDNVPDDLTSSITNLLYDCAAVLQRRVHRTEISHRVAIFMRHRRNMIARELNAEKPVDRAPGLAMGFRDRIALLMSKEGLQGLPDDIDHSNIQDLADEDEMK